MIELVDEPMLTTSTPKSRGTYTPSFRDWFISSKSMTSHSQLLSPGMNLFALWQDLSDLPLKPLRYATFGWVDLQPWSPATSQQESAMQSWESPIVTTCRAKKAIAPRKRVVFSYDAAIALYGINILSIEHTRAEDRPNCRPNLHRRQRNTRRFRDITRHCHPLHNFTIHRIVRHCKPAHKPEPCQIILYISTKITGTHHDVRSPCVHPLADARSVK
ncbi:hypothetical protein EDD22DRAFT_901327 [Suillus occidentalis]|nr:hypothetical protein EDD22DRAFT_901327 [Suillus occidentalis]